LVEAGPRLGAASALLAARQSAFGEALAEGIIIKNLQRGLFGKFINAEFRQGVENAENWRRDQRKRNRLVVQLPSS